MSDYTREAFERDRFATAGPVQPPATPQEPDAPVRRKRQLPCPGCVWEADRVGEAWQHASDCREKQTRAALKLVREKYHWCKKCERWVPEGWACMHYGWTS